jgi:alpha-beta hydrolase superfamily lysophospholipase
MEPLHASDGVSLHWRHWPATEAPRGSVLVVHGLGEHGGRYAHVAALLNAAGWHVFGHDHRGHGASGGARGGLNRDDDLLRDLALVIDFVAEALEASPADWQRPVDALAMSSPALDIGMKPLQRKLLAVLAPMTPNLATGNGLKPEWVSRDPAVVLAYKNDPLVHDRVTPRLVRFFVDGGAFVLERAPRWRTQTLLMWAGADRCVAPRGSAAFAAAAPRSVVQAQEWPGLYHEIFNEPEQQQVIGTLAQWLAQRGH